MPSRLIKYLAQFAFQFCFIIFCDFVFEYICHVGVMLALIWVMNDSKADSSFTFYRPYSSSDASYRTNVRLRLVRRTIYELILATERVYLSHTRLLITPNHRFSEL